MLGYLESGSIGQRNHLFVPAVVLTVPDASLLIARILESLSVTSVGDSVINKECHEDLATCEVFAKGEILTEGATTLPITSNPVPDLSPIGACMLD